MLCSTSLYYKVWQKILGLASPDLDSFLSLVVAVFEDMEVGILESLPNVQRRPREGQPVVALTL